jgi:hypothetical protein
MTTQKITLTVDSATPDGRLFRHGAVRILPSFTRVGDPGDQVLIEQAPARVQFGGRVAPTVMLFPTDLIGPQPQGWNYTVYYDGCPGNPQPWDFYLNSGDGPAQRLSALAPVEGTQPAVITDVDGGSAVTGNYPAGNFDGGSASG